MPIGKLQAFSESSIVKYQAKNYGKMWALALRKAEQLWNSKEKDSNQQSLLKEKSYIQSIFGNMDKIKEE